MEYITVYVGIDIHKESFTLTGFATPLPPFPPLLTAACGSLHLAATTRGGTFTCKNCAMSGTTQQRPTIGGALNTNWLFLVILYQTLFRRKRCIGLAALLCCPLPEQQCE